jgi:DNA repair protein RecO (recombination protein O)
MPTIKTRGIVIRKSNLGEADRILTILTSDRGKIRVVAKGVRRTKAKLSGWLDMFADNQLELAEGRNLDIVTGATAVRQIMTDKLTLQQTGLMYYFCELVDKLIEETHDVPEVFGLLQESLLAVADEVLSLNILKTYFEIKLLTGLGLSPELYRCVVSGQELNEEDRLYFSYRLGGVFCDGKNQDDFAPEISKDGIKLLRLLQRYPLDTIGKVKVTDETVEEVSRLMSEFVEFVTDRRIRSLRVLAEF